MTAALTDSITTIMEKWECKWVTRLINTTRAIRSKRLATELIRGPCHFRAEPYTQANGAMGRETGRANKSGRTVLVMKAVGSTTRPMATENCSMLTAIFMKETGKMIRQTEEEFIRTLMELNITGSGKTISNTVSELKAGQTEQFMKVSTSKGRRTEKANSHLRMAQSMTGNLK